MNEYPHVDLIKRGDPNDEIAGYPGMICIDLDTGILFVNVMPYRWDIYYV